MGEKEHISMTVWEGPNITTRNWDILSKVWEGEMICERRKVWDRLMGETVIYPIGDEGPEKGGKGMSEM